MDFNISYDEAKYKLNEFIAKKYDTLEVISEIQNRIAPKILIDKCPDYSYKKEILNKIENNAENNKYIVLCRNPLSVIESFVRNRFHKVMDEIEINPFYLANEMWVRVYQNILSFVEKVDKSRYIIVKYEDLVSSPGIVIKKICAFLNISYEEELINPYDKNSLIVGSGDNNIFQHDGIKSSFKEPKKTTEIENVMTKTTKVMAEKLGYNQGKYVLGNEQVDLSAISEEDMDRLLSGMI